MPFVIAFLRDNPNLGYSVQEIEKETGHSASGLSREAKKPGSQIVACPQKGYYMWTTTKQNVKIEKEAPDNPENLEYVGDTKDGSKVYRAGNTLYRLIFEEM